ncbi:response regulator [Nocardioides sp. B-3]|uniref:response regulator n=1 Tax=Nocardioides sp. B-3 TaxID=2895565 RepID=UPI002152F15D|nr:response regulator transcription factor [Nocardioides sp. B-3]UUZ58254.1 response regulator transcription factor [Nocardioides sp. B-3]
MISVLVVDDHQLVRRGLEAVLASAGDIELVGQAADGRAAVELATDVEPDVILMDLQLPVLSGPDATREILATRPETAVLVLTMFEDDDTVHAAVAAGAVGYLLKGADGEDILAAARSAAAGQAVFGAAIAHRLQTFFAGAPPTASVSFPQLTDRERAILDKLAAGLTNVEIGRALFLSPKTVANNVSMILSKLDLSERGRAIVLARDAGLGRSR